MRMTPIKQFITDEIANKYPNGLPVDVKVRDLYDEMLPNTPEGLSFSYGTLYEYVRALNGNPVRPVSHSTPTRHVHVPATERTPLEVRPLDMSTINYRHTFIRTDRFVDKLFCRRGAGGVMGGSTTIMAGESSAGKTTFGLSFIADLKAQNPDKKIGYLNSEMSRRNLAFYLDELPDMSGIETLLLRDYNADDIKEAIESFLNMKWDFILVDSFQDILEILKTVHRDRGLEGWLVDLFVKKAEEQGTAIILIQHMTKNGEYRGSAYLKHATDAMLEIRIDKKSGKRYMIFSKNRVGIMGRRLYWEVKNKELLFDEMRYHTDTLAIEAAEAAGNEKEDEEEELI